MTTAYSSLMGLALPVQGELSGTWGDTVNNGITNYLDVALAGTQTISGNQTAVTLSLTNGNASATNIAQAGSGATGSAQYAIINCTGNPASLLTITVPASSRQYVVINATSTSQSVKVVGVGPTTGVTIVSGEKAHIVWNGSDFVKVASTAPGAAAGSNTQVQYNSSGSLAGSANLTFDGTTLTTTGNAVISDNSSSAALRITQTGAGNALVVEDSANPDSSPFVIDGSGNVFVGYTASTAPSSVSGAEVQVNSLGSTQGGLNLAQWTSVGSGSAQLLFSRSLSGVRGTQAAVTSGTAIGKARFFGSDGTNLIEAASIESFVDGTPGTNDMPGRLVFSTTADGASSPTERMRIDNAGKIGIGVSPISGATLSVAKAVTGATTGYGVLSNGQAQSDVTSIYNNFHSAPSTQATTFTLTDLRHYNASQGTIGAGSTVTNQIGFNASSALTGATNNYGFYGNIASGTGRWNFYAAGTADNYFAGNVGIGTNSISSRLHIREDLNGTARTIIQNRNGSGTPVAELSFITGSFDLVDNRYAYINSAGTSSPYIAFGTSAGAAPVERMRIGSNGTISLGAAPGSESLRVMPVASAVNYWNFQGSATGNAIAFYASGSDSNILVNYVSKGTGGHAFLTNGGAQTQFSVAHTASAVNYVQATGAATTASPSLTAAGSDTNIDLNLTPKGTGKVNVSTRIDYKVAGVTSEYAIGNAGASKTVTWSNGAAQSITLDQNTTLTFSFTSCPVGMYQLKITQDGTGGRTITWSTDTPGTTKWIGSAGAPALNSAASSVTFVNVYWDGTNAYGTMGRVNAV